MLYGPEYRFERRIRKFLERAGYLVVKCARSKPFDLVAIKDGKAVPIELKARRTPYSKEQQEMQMSLAKKAKFDFVVIRQAKTHGKVYVKAYLYKRDCFVEGFCELLPPIKKLLTIRDK